MKRAICNKVRQSASNQRLGRIATGMGVLLLALAWSGAAMAATCTSKASGNWSAAATWTCVGAPVVTIPGATDTAIIASPNTVILDNSVPVINLTVNAGGILSDTGGRTLTVTGNIVNNGTFTSTNNGRIASTGAAAQISGSGTFAGSARLYTSGAAPTILAGSALTFAGTATIRAGVNAAGTTVTTSVLTINGTLTSTQVAGTNFLRLYANSTIIGSTGVISAANSTITYNTAAATLSNNGSVNVNRITRNAVSNVWTQGVNSSLTVSAVSTVGTLNASASGNTVTYNGTSTLIAPSAAGYWNLAGTIFPAACPVSYTISGSSPCPAGGPVTVTMNPGSCVNTAGIGAVAWTPTPTNNVNLNDALYATSALNNNTSNYLKCTGYNFAIPATATILGVTVNVVRKSSGNRTTDAAMRLVKAGVIGAVDRATTTVYPTADTSEAHGSSADLWGVAWTPADINLATFGAAFATKSTRTRTVSVNHMPITVTYQPAVALDHIRIEHNGGACSGAGAPAQITIKACTDAACTTFYSAGNVTGINLSATGGAGTYTWSPANPQTIASASGGINSAITLTSSIAATAALAISGTPNPAPANTYDCYNANTGVSGVAGSTACNLAFSTDSFTYSVPDHTSATRQVVTLTSCKATFKNKSRDLKFWSTYTNPATGTLQGKVAAGTGDANCVTAYSALGTSSASPATLSLAFSNTTVPQATFSLCYPDVGDVKLETRYDGSAATSDNGVVILGSDNFIAKPAGFTLSNIKRSSDGVANPGATDAGGTVFVKAGEAFTATVTAVNALVAATPNYGKETIPESVKLTPALAAGLGLTNNPGVVGNFGDFGKDCNGVVDVAWPGKACGTAFKWDEVGIITLTPSVGDGDYLGVGDVTGTTSGNVGRFSLGKFALQNVTFDDRADLCQGGLLVSDGVTTCASSFTYMGEQINANFTLVPNSLNDVVVQNYVDSATAADDFAKLDPSIFANLNMAAVDSATAGGPYYLTARISNAAMPVAACADTLCFQSGSADVTVPFTLSRNASPDGAYGIVEIGIAPLDGDGARVEGAGVTPGLCNNPNAADCNDLDTDATAGDDRALLAATEFRYGRIKISNAYGSELLPLPLTATVQFYNTAGGWMVSDTDNLTTISNSDFALAFPVAAANKLAACETALSVAGSSPNFRINMSMPGTGNNGWTDLTLNLGAIATGNRCIAVGGMGALSTTSNQPWLQYPAGSNPTGRATFGVYKGRNDFIYQRESY